MKESVLVPSQGLRDSGDGGALHKALGRECPPARPCSFPCSLDGVEGGEVIISGSGAVRRVGRML